jgi:hypothetical protein
VCIAKIDYPSPLLGRIDGYICTVNRFVIPTHTLYLNDRMKSAIILYTNDRVLLVDTGGAQMGGQRELSPLDVDHLREDADHEMTPAQTAYFEAEHTVEVAN